jgi:hypothetical protein
MRRTFGLVLAIWGCASPSVRVPEEPRPVEVRQPIEVRRIWEASGLVADRARGQHNVYLTLSSWDGARFYSIDLATHRVVSRVVDPDATVVHVDPLVVELWEGSMPRWRGTRLVRLDDTLAPVWQSEMMNMETSQWMRGRLVIVEVTSSSQYFAFDPEDGRVVAQAQGDQGDGIFGYAMQGRGLLAIPTMERTLLFDDVNGQARATLPVPFGSWTVLGSRVIASHGDRLAAYDRDGHEVWSRAGTFRDVPRPLTFWRPADQPPMPELVIVWDSGRGLAAYDEAGRERWLYPSARDEDAERWVLRGMVVIESAEGHTLLDPETGAVRYRARPGAAIGDIDPSGWIIERPVAGGRVEIALVDRDGRERWARAIVPFEEVPTVALLPDAVAVCEASGVTFFDRADGHPIANEAFPAAPERGFDNAPSCAVSALGDLALLTTEKGAVLFEATR